MNTHDTDETPRLMGADAAILSQQGTPNEALDERQYKSVAVPHHLMTTVMQQADAALDRVHEELKDLEIRRADLSREIGRVQTKIDGMTKERERRKAHQRELLRAIDRSTT